MAASLDGSANGQATAVSSADWTFGTGDFTVAYWIKVANGYTTTAVVIGNRTNTNWWRMMFDNSVANSLDFSLTDIAPTPGLTSTMNDGNWHSVVVTRSSGTVKMYLDNSEEYSGTNATDLNGQDTLTIGSQETSTLPLTGTLANIAIKKGTAWSTGDVAIYHSSGGQTVPASQDVYYEFASGTLTTDSSGNSHTLTAESGFTYTSDEPPATATGGFMTLNTGYWGA